LDVFIVAVGARTPVGYEAASSAAAVRSGLAQFQDHPFIVDRRGESVRAAMDDGLDPQSIGGVRPLTFGRSALEEALSGLRLDATSPRLDVLVALPESRPGFTDAHAAWIARELTRGLSPRPAELAARGHAGALEAISQAAQRIVAGQSDLCAVVGADSYLAPDTILWLQDAGRLADQGNRDGFIPGEAGGCIVVMSDYAMRMMQLTPLARVRGAFSAREQNLISGDAEVFGRGLEAAILGAAASLQLPAEAVDSVYCDINGERYRTDEWCFAVLRASHAMRTLQYELPAGCWGDVGAASGVLGCMLAVRAWARKYAAGPRALVWGGSEGGLRSAVVLENAGAT
jgi:3-oxoacyl-[acyl-carrier-protein] synthase I